MKTNKKTETTMLDRRKWLKAWAKLRNYDLGCRTESFLACYYFTDRALYSQELSRKLLENMNRNMAEPLPTEVLEKISDWNMQRITNKKIIRWLGITEAECAQLRIGHNLQEVEARDRRKFHKTVKIFKIQSLYDSGLTAAEISAEFPEFDKRTIQRYLADYRKLTMTKDQKDAVAYRILELYQSTNDLNSIARQARCDVETVCEILNLGGMTKITKQETQKKTRENLEFTTYEGRELYQLSVTKTDDTQVELDEYHITLDILRTYKKPLGLFGPGGTGKSFIIKAFLASLSSEERAATLVVAPTGKAADNLDAQTIHKAFRLPNEVQPNEEITTAPKELFAISRIIVDEVNMVRQDVFSRMIKTIQFVEKQTQKPIQVIVLGDFGQIQPVATPADLELLKEFYPKAKGVYAFHSEQWEQMDFRLIYLKHIYRQDEPEFKEKLHEIKYGNISAIQWFNEHSNQRRDMDAITICPTNNLVDYYNKLAWSNYALEAMTNYTATFQYGTTSEDLPCPEKLQLSVGMRVMTVCNKDKYKNGSVGTIIKTNPQSIQVRFDNNVVATIRKHSFTLQDGVVYKQIPVVLAYAITANKSEGMTFDKINVVPGFFAPGQLYTALSRCRSIKGIYIEGELTAKDLHIDIEALRMTINRD